MRTEQRLSRIARVNGFPCIKRNNMPLQTFLKPEHFLQTLVLALSTFNLVTFLWLALPVWLNGDRRASITPLAVLGLSFSSLSFFILPFLFSIPLNPPASIF